MGKPGGNCTANISSALTELPTVLKYEIGVPASYLYKKAGSVSSAVLYQKF